MQQDRKSDVKLTQPSYHTNINTAGDLRFIATDVCQVGR